MTIPGESSILPLMPGYKALPSFMTGDAADQVREAEARHRIGDSTTAVQLLEEALAAISATRPAYPGWLCGRLAALYRTLGRYDDEVHLLERYRESQTSEDARTRYDARLSKARTIAERKRPRESGALESVRASIGRPRARRARSHELTPPPPAAPSGASGKTFEVLRIGLAAAAHDPSLLLAALHVLVAEGRRANVSVDRLVATLKTAAAPSTGATADRHSAAYGDALVQLLALYFEEVAS